MTRTGKLVSYFPAVMFAGSVATFGWFVVAPSLVTVLVFFTLVYLVPPFVFRLHQLWRPLKEGASRLDKPEYSSWWASHCFQLFYECLPFLEAALRVVPGCYSAWLRLWGARVGKGVYWTPRVEIVDRPMIDIGDRAVFGHKVECYAHLIRHRGEGLRLLVQRIHIGADAVIGAGSRLGPGAKVPDGAIVPVLTDIGVKQTFGAQRGAE